MSFKLCFKLKLLLLFIFLGLFSSNDSSWAQVKPPRSDTNASEARQNNSSELPQLPARGSPVGRRRGGTSRNNCPNFDLPLTAIVPGKERVAQSVSYLATTVSEKPTFWVYIPQLPDLARTGEFVLQTEAGEDLKRTQIELPSTAGAIAISLPSDSQYSLKIGQKYHWYFKIYCGEPASDAEQIFVDAWIERIAVAPEVAKQLQTANKADYLVYRDRHIWYDALTNLGRQLQTNPKSNELKTDWVDLLESVELSHLSDFPLVKIYQL